MDRGDVFKVAVTLPNRATPSGNHELEKYVILLQGGPAFITTTEVAVLIASSYRAPAGSQLRPFEVLLDASDGFHHDTVVDGRWPYTLRKSIITAGEYLTTLSGDQMYAIDLAMIKGLQIGSTRPRPTQP